MASLVLGVLGLKRAGKDAFASRLVSEFGYTRIALADPMRTAMLALDPFVVIEHDEVGPLAEAAGFLMPYGHIRLSTLVEAVGWEAAKGLREVRRLLQRFGTEAGREIHGEDAWVNITARAVATVEGPVVITDVRFPNEVAYAERVGMTVRIVRPGLVNDSSHASENSVNDVKTTFTVVNNSDLDHLYEQADRVHFAATIDRIMRRADAVSRFLSH